MIVSEVNTYDLLNMCIRTVHWSALVFGSIPYSATLVFLRSFMRQVKDIARNTGPESEKCNI